MIPRLVLTQKTLENNGNRDIYYYLLRFPVGAYFRLRKGNSKDSIYKVIGYAFWDCLAAKMIENPSNTTNPILMTVRALVVKDSPCWIFSKMGECHGFSLDVLTSGYDDAFVFAGM